MKSNLTQEFFESEGNPEEVMQILTEIQTQTILMRLEGYTLASVGEQLAVSRERARQIEKEALKKMGRYITMKRREVDSESQKKGL